MAFNPFTSFRKHQKVWMASILIVCMMTFVLCTGLSGGDLGSWLLSLFGGNRGHTIASFDGKNVTDSELSQVRAHRRLANEFMVMAAQRGRQIAMTEILRSVEDPTAQRILDSLVGESLRQPEFGTFMFDFRLNQLLGDARGAQGETIRKIAPILRKWAPKIKPILEQAAPNARYEKAGQYFAGGSETDDDLFAFILWREEAKKQGFAEIDDQGVREEVRLATHPRFSTDDWKALELRLKTLKYASATPDSIKTALLDEFRVRQCQTNLLGFQPGPGATPEVAVTPDQAWEYYKAKRSDFNVEVLPIPVEPFVSEVKEAPPEKELQALFNKYKSVEKDPASSDPGFKQSRKVQVAWITGDPASPYYKGASALVFEMSRSIFPLAWRARVLQEYRAKQFNYKLPALTEPNFVLPFYQATEDSDNDKIQKYVGLTAEAIGMGISGQGLGTGPQSLLGALPTAYQGPALVRAVRQEASMQAGIAATALLAGSSPIMTAGLTEYAARPDYYLPVERERTKRTGVAATLLLSGIASAPIGPRLTPPLMYAGLTRYAGPESIQYLPLEMVQDQIVKKIIEDDARRLLADNMKAVKEEIDKFNPAEKDLAIRTKKVTDRMKEAAKKYHLTLGETSRPLDKATIGDDTGLKPLKETFSAQGDIKSLFFPSADSAPLYVPKALGDFGPSSSQNPVLYWTTADEAARVLKSYESIRADVAKEWKLQKARVRARNKARAAVAIVSKASDDTERAELLEAQEKALRKAKILKDDERTIPLFDVAALKPPLSTTADSFPGGQKFSEFRVPADKFSYPKSDEWSKKILSMGTTGAKVQILDNQPETIVYVVARVKAPEARKSAFLDSNRRHDDMWTRWNQKFARDLYNRKVEELKRVRKFKDLRSDTAKAQAKTKKETPAPLDEE